MGRARADHDRTLHRRDSFAGVTARRRLARPPLRVRIFARTIAKCTGRARLSSGNWRRTEGHHALEKEGAGGR